MKNFKEGIVNDQVTLNWIKCQIETINMDLLYRKLTQQRKLFRLLWHLCSGVQGVAPEVDQPPCLKSLENTFWLFRWPPTYFYEIKIVRDAKGKLYRITNIDRMTKDKKTVFQSVKEIKNYFKHYCRDYNRFYQKFILLSLYIYNVYI